MLLILRDITNDKNIIQVWVKKNLTIDNWTLEWKKMSRLVEVILERCLKSDL
jgi:hypothetical protein